MVTRRSNRTRGTRRDNLGLSLKARAIRQKGTSGGRGSASPVPIYYFNGIDMYATHSAWDTLGNWDVYGEVTFSASGSTDDVLELPPPIVEFGRVGLNYHEGEISKVRYTDTSPIQDTDTKATSVGTVGPFQMDSGSVAFDYIHAGDEDIIVDFLSSVGGVLTLTNANTLSVDGTAYAGETMNVGQHYSVAFVTTGGTLTTVNSTLGMQNLEIYTDL